MPIRAVATCLLPLLIAFLVSPCGAAEQGVVPPLPGHAPVTVPLTLADLERIAIESNPTLVQARMAIRAAEGSHLQAGLYPNPTLEYIADEIGNDGSEGLQGGGVTQEIVTSGKRRLGLAVTSHEIQQARHAWEAQRWRVINDVRVGYYEALLAQKTIDVNEQLLGVEEQLLKAAQQLRGAQEVSEVDVLQARVEMENAQLNLAQRGIGIRPLGGGWQRCWAGRKWSQRPLAGDVTGNLPVITWEDALSRLLAQSPELARAAPPSTARSAIWPCNAPNGFPTSRRARRSKKTPEAASRLWTWRLGCRFRFSTATRGISFERRQLRLARTEIRRVELELRDRLATAFEQYVGARRRARRLTPVRSCPTPAARSN